MIINVRQLQPADASNYRYDEVITLRRCNYLRLNSRSNFACNVCPLIQGDHVQKITLTAP